MTFGPRSLKAIASSLNCKECLSENESTPGANYSASGDAALMKKENPVRDCSNNNTAHCDDEEVPKKMKARRNSRRGPPDGGWGWVIVFASFMIHVIADGVTYTFGIFYFELVRYFSSGKGLTAWVPSIMTGMTLGIGPLASALTNKYGCRPITIIGAILAATGLLTSVFASSVITLFFTVGLCAGAGFGLIFLPAIVSVTCYFEKKRAFATGIAVSGSGIGSALFAPLTDYLIYVYGWRGAMVIISALVLNCCVFGALLRPLEMDEELDDEEEEEEENQLEASKADENKGHDINLKLRRPLLLEIPGAPEVATSLPTHQELYGETEDTVNVNFENDSLTVSSSFANFTSPRFTIQDSIDETMANERESSPPSPSRHSFAAFAAESLMTSGEMANSKSSSNKSMEDLSPSKSLRMQPNGVVVVSSKRASQKRSRKTSVPEKFKYLGTGVLSRKDIFYSRSLNNLPAFKSNPVLHSNGTFTSLKEVIEKVPEVDEDEESTEEIQSLCCPKEIVATFRLMMDFKILKNRIFLLFAISNFLTSLGFYVPHIYLKDRIIDLNLASDQDASNLLGVIGIGSTIGRLVFGYFSDRAFVNRLALYNICLTICGLSTIMSSFEIFSTYEWMMAYAATFGITCGAYVSLTSVILVDLLGLEHLTNAFGILLLFQGIACLMGPPVIGWLYDVTNSYNPGFSLAGSMIAISGLMLFVVPHMERKMLQRQLEEEKQQAGQSSQQIPILIVS